MGFVLLEGGREFSSGMEAADRRALDLAGGLDAPIRIIPAAAAPDGNDRRAGENGVSWFKSLGASDVLSLRIVDRASADLPEPARQLAAAGLIFLLGGFTRHLAETLDGSRAWEAMREAFRRGAVLGGSSAGAMVLCGFYFDPISEKVLRGLDLLPGACVLPHHEVFGKGWAPRLCRRLPGSLMIGIDEATGLLNDGPEGEWTVYGRGAVTVYPPEGRTVSRHGERFPLPIAVKGAE